MKGKNLLSCVAYAFLLSSMTMLHAQEDPYIVFQKILDAYQTDKFLSYEVAYEYFDNLDGQEPSSSLHLEVQQKGTNYYLQSREGDILSVDGQYLLVNHSDKQMLLSEATSKSHIVMGFDIETIKEIGQKEGLHLVEISISDKLGGLRFEAPTHSQTTMDFVYHKDSYLLHHVHVSIQVNDDFATYLGGMQNTQLRAKYSNYSISDKPFRYSTQHYIKSNKVTAAYQDYELIR